MHALRRRIQRKPIKNSCQTLSSVELQDWLLKVWKAVDRGSMQSLVAVSVENLCRLGLQESVRRDCVSGMQFCARWE